MENNSPKHIALKTLIKYRCYSLNDYNDLKGIIESNLFTIIEYKKHTNTEPICELIEKLKIKSEIEHNNSFLYINNNLRFVFINEEICEQDKCALLCHELGHIFDPDFMNGGLHYSDIQKEEFANDFSYYIRNPDIWSMMCVWFAKYRVLLFAVMALTTCILTGLFVFNTLNSSKTKATTGNASSAEVFDDTYYVTSSGKKYHRRHCFIIKYKNNLTEIELSTAADNGYEPCLICNPENYIKPQK